jgi:hypothetical protein
MSWEDNDKDLATVADNIGAGEMHEADKLAAGRGRLRHVQGEQALYMAAMVLVE